MEAYASRLESKISSVFFLTASQQMFSFTPICLFVCVDALPSNQQFKSCLDEFLTSSITKQLIKRLAQ